MELLKESVADRGHDTTKSVDMKGPFLDPILGYDGGGELPTHKDASSILERYYFNQDSDKGVAVTSEDASIRQVGNDKGALKDVPEDVDKSKKDAAKATELKEDELFEDEDLLEDDVENAVIERLIAEMEEDDGLLYEEDFKGDKAAKFHEPSGDPDKDKSGLVDGDDHKGGEGAVKPATFPAGSDGVGKGYQKEDLEMDDTFDDLLEMEEEDAPVPGGKETPDDDAKEDEDEVKDFDKEVGVKKESGSPIGNPGTADEFESLEESFDIFTEAMEDDDAVDLDDDDILV
jgi:hypothetical protein